MKKYIDLHMHTNCSDGSKTPSELLAIVRSKKLSAFAVTDHDTIDGYLAIKEMLIPDDPILISGVELSVSLSDGDMHLLAYLFDPESSEFITALKNFQLTRQERGKKMVAKLNALGLDISYSDVEKETKGSAVGRPHIAHALYNAKLTTYYEEAFHKYISDSGPAYVPKENFSPKDAIDLVHNAGGVVVLAHPGINNKEKYLDELSSLGLDGIEAMHSSHKVSDVDKYKHLAEKHHLCVTGGSDYHGLKNRHGSVGSQNVPYKYFEILLERAKKN